VVVWLVGALLTISGFFSPCTFDSNVFSIPV